MTESIHKKIDEILNGYNNDPLDKMVRLVKESDKNSFDKIIVYLFKGANDYIVEHIFNQDIDRTLNLYYLLSNYLSTIEYNLMELLLKSSVFNPNNNIAYYYLYRWIITDNTNYIDRYILFYKYKNIMSDWRYVFVFLLADPDVKINDIIKKLEIKCDDLLFITDHILTNFMKPIYKFNSLDDRVVELFIILVDMGYNLSSKDIDKGITYTNIKLLKYLVKDKQINITEDNTINFIHNAHSFRSYASDNICSTPKLDLVYDLLFDDNYVFSLKAINIIIKNNRPYLLKKILLNKKTLDNYTINNDILAFLVQNNMCDTCLSVIHKIENFEDFFHIIQQYDMSLSNNQTINLYLDNKLSENQTFVMNDVVFTNYIKMNLYKSVKTVISDRTNINHKQFFGILVKIENKFSYQQIEDICACFSQHYQFDNYDILCAFVYRNVHVTRYFLNNKYPITSDPFNALFLKEINKANQKSISDIANLMVNAGYTVTYSDVLFATKFKIELNIKLNFPPNEIFYSFCDFSFIPEYNTNLYKDQYWLDRMCEIASCENDHKTIYNFIKKYDILPTENAIKTINFDLRNKNGRGLVKKRNHNKLIQLISDKIKKN
jgi:hypothetical protein